MRIQDLFARKRLLFLSAALFAFQLNAKAEEDAPPALQWHGYGTMTNSRILKEQDRDWTGGYGSIDKSGTFLYNSLVGLNMSYAINEQLTFYGQLTALGSVVASGYTTDSYPVRADMAFFSYRPFDWLDVRIGRQIMPIWMVSEQIDVGVTYPWIRPPSDVYNLAPLKSATGVGFDVAHNIADVFDVKAGVRVGQGSYVDSSNYTHVDLNRAFVGYAEVKYNNMLTLRTSYGSTYAFANTVGTNMVKQAQFNTAYQGCFAAGMNVSQCSQYIATQAGLTPGSNEWIAAAAAANASAMTSSPTGYAGAANYQTEFTFYSFGGKLDWKDLSVMGEYAATNQEMADVTAVDSQSVALVPTGIYKYRSWYATAAYHFGDWTPHVTYSQVERNLSSGNYNKILNGNYNTRGALASSAGITDQSLGQSFTSVVKRSLNPSAKIRTVTLGLNYNFTPTVVGKLQLQQVRTSMDGDSGAYNKATATTAGGPSNFNLLNGQYMSSNDIYTIGEAGISFVF